MSVGQMYKALQNVLEKKKKLCPIWSLETLRLETWPLVLKPQLLTAGPHHIHDVLVCVSKKNI